MLTLEPFSPLPAEAKDPLKAEGLALLRFLTGKSQGCEVIVP